MKGTYDQHQQQAGALVWTMVVLPVSLAYRTSRAVVSLVRRPHWGGDWQG